MERTASAAEAAASPPTCLNGFAHAVLPLRSDGLDLSVDFRIACLTCNRDTFYILGFPLVAPDPSPYYGLEPGDVFFRPPHRLRCSNCGRTEPLFDPRSQGFDGLLNKCSGYETGDEGEEAEPRSFRIVVAFAYNIELDELKELSAEAGVRSSDLFDWFTISGYPLDGGSPYELSYECA